MKWLAQAKMKVRGHNIVYKGEDDNNDRWKGNVRREAFMGLLMIMVKRAINGADETEYRGEIDQRLVCFKHAK